MRRLAALLLLLVLAPLATAAPPVTIGSKSFTESYLLAEILAQRLEGAGFQVRRRPGLGGTLIAYRALIAGEVDVYVEYSGTLSRVILQGAVPPERSALEQQLAAQGLAWLPDLGFDNSYALALPAALARELELQRISDLRQAPDLRLALSHEFIDREDGWRGLRARYDLPHEPRGIEHGLAYQALARGRADLTDAYVTDADLERHGLVVLEDDRGFFPAYRAAPLARAELAPEVRNVIASLAGRIDDDRMRLLNAAVVVDGRSFAAVAADFLAAEGFPASPHAAPEWNRQLLANLMRHLQLTGAALAAAVLLGLPAGIWVHRRPAVARSLLYSAGLMQTIPSIALLALLIPLLGIGWWPAVVALFLYALLPILRSTVTAFNGVDPQLVRVARGMGLTRRQQIRYLLLPLAWPHILSGIRMAAVISIGTATLAAFVGAGGLGEPIVTGLALNDTRLILQGAVPAALLAIVTELLFEGIERVLVPPHLRSRASG